MSHTPGPWFVDWDEEDGWNHHIVHGDGDNRLCFMAHNGPEHKDEFDANARLIAAAPDMLAALEAILAMGGMFDLIDAHDIAAPAVKKATQP